MVIGSSVKSPCINKCWDVDQENDVCRGCFRSLEEIEKWPGMADGQKRAVLKRCKRRSKKPEGAAERLATRFEPEGT